MYQFMDRVARLFAILGGIILSILIVQTCLSILGRSISTILHSDFMQTNLPGLASSLLSTGVGSINGAFELVEAGMAFVIFAFLPLCQLKGAHASVDIFTSQLPARANVLLRTVIEVIFALVIVLIAYELSQGMLSKLRTGQTTFILEFPVWWPYALSLIAAVASAIVAVYVACMRVIEMATGQTLLPLDLEAEH
ncbi:TRAP transporter small permease [Planktotalea frisia]|jgi:TRAP-type C4-dicarboxylate transport system permease small subunit|uniref:TRAP transporter small permease n=1 Tax=Planktotalea frisia TaxID=696762 RepID=UPI002333FBCB|nr:TRAP transporter small permease [Planktotalea frisia]MDB2455585.1 TRAP transporter small permease [Planktomarina temperata]MDB9707129.1 TRAP transporter small permease [Planktotalea frisia]